jgi:hypothetical protein
MLFVRHSGSEDQAALILMAFSVIKILGFMNKVGMNC